MQQRTTTPLSVAPRARMLSTPQTYGKQKNSNGQIQQRHALPEDVFSSSTGPAVRRRELIRTSTRCKLNGETGSANCHHRKPSFGYRLSARQTLSSVPVSASYLGCRRHT